MTLERMSIDGSYRHGKFSYSREMFNSGREYTDTRRKLFATTLSYAQVVNNIILKQLARDGPST